MSKMKENFDLLEQRIMEAHETDAYKKVQNVLENIDGNTVTVGAGGSFAVADYIAKSVSGLALSLKPREFLFEKLNKVEYVILVSYSGKSPDILQCLRHCRNYKNLKNVIVLTWDDSVVKSLVELDENVEVIGYRKNDSKEKSFISIASTLAPISLFARQFVEKKGLQFDRYLKDVIANAQVEVDRDTACIDFAKLKDNPYIEVIYESETRSTAAMLESNLTETGMVYHAFHEKKDFSHGRYSLDYLRETPILLWMKNSSESEYDKKLMDYFREAGVINKLAIVRSSGSDLVGEFELMLKGMFLTKNIAEKVGQDICEHTYPAEAKSIYKFDGGLL